MAYLEVLGCLEKALVELLGDEVDFKVIDGFEVVNFGGQVYFGTRECEGFRGRGRGRGGEGR